MTGIIAEGFDVSAFGQMYDLEQPRVQGMPIIDVHEPGYAYFLYRRHADTLAHQAGTTGRSSASGLLMMMEHSGTHIDALCHQAEELAIHGGHTADSIETSRGFSAEDATKIPPFFHRAVLLDVAAFRGKKGIADEELISAAELKACAEKQGTQIPKGGIVFVRTGNGAKWDNPDVYLAGPGMAADASVWLADHGVVAVGADNVAWDVPGYVDEQFNCDLPGHLILLVRSGIFIFENLALEEIAAAGVHTFTLIAVPLKLQGATGSPVRPLALADNGKGSGHAET